MQAHESVFSPATRERRALGLEAAGAARPLNQVPPLRAADGPGRATVLNLQRTAGNAALARLLNGGRSPVRGTARRRLQRDAATDVLVDLATPRTGAGQAIEAQKQLIAVCEKVVTGLITGGVAADPEHVEYHKALAQYTKESEAWRADKTKPFQQWVEASTKWKKNKKGEYQQWLTASTKWKKDKKGPYQKWLKTKEGPEPQYDQNEPRYQDPQPEYPVPLPPSPIRGQIYADAPDFHIGGILLDKLPKYQKEKFGKAKATERFYKDLIKHAKIVSPRAVGATSYKGNVLPEIVEGGFGRLMAENALKTMIDAEQFKYLLAAGLPNEEWKIFIEMHYYRARDKEMAGFHKDTRGQTLFVNLNYHIEDKQQQGLATRGPEYVVNPPTSAKHDAQIYGTVGKPDVPVKQQKAASLPPKFTSDLTEVRQGLDAPNVIKSAGRIEPYGYVAFVDEAIHHATPFDQGRYVTPTEFKNYLEETHPKELAEIRGAEQEKRAWNTDVIPKPDREKWKTWYAMMLAKDDKQRTTRYNREKLADMTDEEFRKMLAVVGSKPGAERKFGGAGGWYAAAIADSGAETPLTGSDKPALRREASMQDVTRNLPAPLPADVSRRFIRTWVRAIPETVAAQLRGGAQ